LSSAVTDCCFISFSLNTDADIGNEGAIKLSEALKANSSLASLLLRSSLHFISFSLNTDSGIGSEGGIKLSEALIGNTSLKSLDLWGNISFFIHTHF
jgi:hypothetical protein